MRMQSSRTLAAILLTVASAAQAGANADPKWDALKSARVGGSVLYDSGSLATHPGAGRGGTDHSTAQDSSMGMRTRGGNVAPVEDHYRIADVFEATALVGAAERYVAEDGDDTANLCLLEDEPCQTIQHAIDVAEEGDTVVLFQGVYTQPITIDQSLTLAGHESAQRPVIEAAEDMESASERVVTVDSPLFEALTVKFQNVEIRHGNTEFSGGGIGCQTICQLTLEDVEIHSNRAAGGGGGLDIDGAANLNGVVISGNVAGDGAGGARIVSETGDVHLSDVKVIDNEGGGILAGGALSGEAIHLSNVLFSANHGGAVGGLVILGGSASLSNVRFHRNESIGSLEPSSPIIPSGGGGLFVIVGSATLTNVSFIENSATSGAGMLLAGELVSNGETFPASSATLANVTFSGNSANDFGGGLRNDGHAILINTILWDNLAPVGAQIFTESGGSTTVDHSLFLEGLFNIAGNGDFTHDNSLHVDPLFVDQEAGDARLTAESPAIDAGEPNTPSGLFPVDGNGTPIDLDGNPRFSGKAIDMGAFEFQILVNEIFDDRFEQP